MPPSEAGQLAATVRQALDAGDREALVETLHPYLHFTDPFGRTTRGRTKVLEAMRSMPVLEPPASVEYRDGQVYRWRCPAAS